jgi:hypothetical protein
MSHYAIRSSIKPGLECFLISIPPGRLFALLGHDPRSQFWKTLPQWLRDIYEAKQRATQKARIDALDIYMRERMMDEEKMAAFPPISIIQFEPFAPAAVAPVSANVVRLEDDELELTRVLIDGLARVTAVQGLRDELRSTNPEACRRLDDFRFTVALYSPTREAIGAQEAGQLFTDFNSYAWPVPMARALADDIYNPYKVVAGIIGQSEPIKRHGGLKKGSSNLGKKDTAFTTELVMAQLAKVAIEGRRGYGKLTRAVSDPLVAGLDLQAAGTMMGDFFLALETAMGRSRFADRAQLFRTAHGLYALAVIIKDIRDGATSQDAAIAGIAGIDWTWANAELCRHIGRSVDGGKTFKLNTGTATLDWLIKKCREVSNVVLTQAA